MQVRGFPSQELAQGHFTKVPLLVDTETYEGFLFSNQSQRTMADEITDLRILFPYAKDSFFTRLYELYPASSYNSTLFQRQTIYGNYIIGMPHKVISEILSMANTAARLRHILHGISSKRLGPTCLEAHLQCRD